MTDGNTHAIDQHLDEREDWDALQEVTVELEQAEARIEELEAKLEEQVGWVKSLADDLIAAEGREARLKEKLAKAVEIADEALNFSDYDYDYSGWYSIRDRIRELKGETDER